MLTMEDDDALEDPAVFNAREPEVLAAGWAENERDKRLISYQQYAFRTCGVIC